MNITGSLQQTNSITVAAGGTLAGTGMISTPGTVTVNGTLAPGTTTGAPLQITGNLLLNPTATYVSNITGGVASWTFVNGVATLGGTLRVRIGSGGVNFQTAYTLLASSQPLVQQFATLDLPGTLKSQVIYNANNVQIIFSPDLTAFAATGNANQQAVGTAIQAGLASSVNPGAFGALLNLDRANLLAAFTQLSGEIATGAAPTGFSAMNSFITTMVNPFLDARGFGTPQGPSLAFAPDTTSDEALGYVQKRKASNTATQAFAQLQGAPRPDTRFTTWASGFGAWAKNDGNALTGSNTLQSRVAGATAGIDYRPTFDTVFGIAMGGAQTSYSIAGGLGNGDANIAQVGVHGAVRLNNAYFSSAFAYGWHSVSTTRVVSLLAPDTIKASYDGQSVSGRIEFGSRYGLQSAGVTPFAAVQVQRFFSPSYQEFRRRIALRAVLLGKSHELASQRIRRLARRAAGARTAAARPRRLGARILGPTDRHRVVHYDFDGRVHRDRGAAGPRRTARIGRGGMAGGTQYRADRALRYRTVTQQQQLLRHGRGALQLVTRGRLRATVSLLRSKLRQRRQQRRQS